MKLIVITIETRHDDVFVEVFDSHETANTYLRQYVEDWWSEEMEDTEIHDPVTDADVAEYFGDSGESYLIHEIDGITTMETLSAGI